MRTDAEQENTETGEGGERGAVVEGRGRKGRERASSTPNTALLDQKNV